MHVGETEPLGDFGDGTVGIDQVVAGPAHFGGEVGIARALAVVLAEEAVLRMLPGGGGVLEVARLPTDPVRKDRTDSGRVASCRPGVSMAPLNNPVH